MLRTCRPLTLLVPTNVFIPRSKSTAVRCEFNKKTHWITTLSSASSNTRMSSIMSSEAGNRNSTGAELSPPESYQEDALHFDCYRDEDEGGPYKTREQKLQLLKQLDNRKPCPWKLDEVYPNTEIITTEKLEEQIKQFGEFKTQMEYKEDPESENPCNDAEKQRGNKDVPEK